MIEILEVLITTLEVSGVVFFMMVLVDFFDVRTRGKIKSLVHKSKWSEYLTASFLGATPGCIGSYINVSMYMHGFMGMGAIAAGMIATSGDEAFVMLVRFPEKALLLFAILFILAIPMGSLLDIILKKLKIKSCEACEMHEHHSQDNERNYKHYFTVHIWQHIFKKHIIRIIIWTFFSLLFVNIGINYFSINELVNNNIGWVILIAALIGIIPESGPHLVFISLFASGVIPFSALLASSISQDGHGMLPMLSYSLRDSIIIKTYNVGVALVIGWTTFYFGF
ncbi:MAG: selenocysteine protein [Calditrichaeota bacterium]|nr:MAG: selenocysteine protein [Calditrichota bacterium]MBL1206858.1 selenocysteine protein [Calditrichota bacterium]NOG46685.1 arsenic efflux protein [Calditrichota bacterium]